MKKFKKKTIGIVAVVLVILLVAVSLINQGNGIEVEVESVEKGHIAEYVEELAVVISENKGNVFSPASGKVSEVLVDVGDSVDEGEVLIRMDSDDLTRQIMELEAQKSLVTAQYNEAAKPADSREIEKLQLQLSTQETIVKEAQRKMANSESLYGEGAISKEEYQAVATALEAEEAKLEGIRLDLELLKKPISQNVASQFEAQLKQLDIQMETLKSKGQDFVITSPLKGTIMTRNVEVGTYLQPGMQLMEIGDGDDLYVESDILVSEIGKVKLGASVEISHKDLGIEGVKGKVRKIHPQAFSKISDLGIEQKRIRVEIDIVGSTDGLRPGYDLDAKLVVEEKENTLIIPESAVFKNEGKNYVFVNEKGKGMLREINTGIESNKEIEVLSGLKEGEKVIISPDEELEEGIKIKVSS